MKKLILLGAIATAFSLVACSDDKPTQVVHETRVVHVHQSVDQPNNNPDDFQAVERPSTYSH